MLRDYDSDLWQTLVVGLLGGVHGLPDDELLQTESQARLPIAHVLGLLPIVTSAPLASTPNPSLVCL